MDFTNEFRVNLPVDRAWALLTDVERIAPCMPGAQLTGVEGDAYNGVVKIKVGPVTVQYKGVASFEEKDDARRTATLHARGRDTRGQGNADARVTARLVPDGDGTRVTVDTRLTITGKIAQFGKGMIQEVSAKLLAQFVDNLEEQLTADRERNLDGTRGAPEPVAGGGADARATPTAEDSRGPQEPRGQGPVASAPETGAGTAAGARPRTGVTGESASVAAGPEPLDLLGVARGAVLKRALPAAIAVAALVVVLVVWLV
ncbi:SRPBCC family protein [Streptomyces cavernae]|uniref:SRPBCC family protein n=1 Tax=Streptomyces cavernae TaxID=2259034 RepID=UPI000FEB77B9|nr:SRPBCC family protein [Streptomyces cavernae]